jgi:hypothetical protein
MNRFHELSIRENLGQNVLLFDEVFSGIAFNEIQ